MAGYDLVIRGGRIVDALTSAGFQAVGVDASAEMVRRARRRHPSSQFVHADICEWLPPGKYDIVVAWDSIFHAPYAEQRPVVGKLCDALAPGGSILFTAGGVDGEIIGENRGQTFYYSSLTEIEYLRVLSECGCKCILLERDSHPDEHIVVIGIKA